MRFDLWISSLWPGCWHAWQGDGRGLVLAISFMIALNGALLTSFGPGLVFGEGRLPQRTIAVASWLLVSGLWSGGLIWLRRDYSAKRGKSENKVRAAADMHFRPAQEEYLRGHWIEAETLLRRLLREDSQDVEAQLLLASVQRRTKRWNDARTTLKGLQAAPTAGCWLPEIEMELSRIDELENEGDAKGKDAPDFGGDLLRAA